MQDSKFDLVYNTAFRTINYIINDLNMGGTYDKIEVENLDYIKPLDITSFINIEGDFTGTVFLSLSNELARELIKNFIYGDVKDSDIKELVAENVSETLNITLGNVLAKQREIKNGGSLEISTPTISVLKNSIQAKNEKRLLVSKIIYKDETLIVGFLEK